MSALTPVCAARGHDLSSRHSFRRMANGRRWCLQCEIARNPTGNLAKRRGRRVDRDWINAQRRDRRYREQAQARAIETSIRITTQEGRRMSDGREVLATPGDVETRSFGAALHLACLGHEVVGVRSRDNSNTYIRFKPDARPALENYYRQRDRLNAVLERVATQPEQEQQRA